jgi:hypothetical protein
MRLSENSEKEACVAGSSSRYFEEDGTMDAGVPGDNSVRRLGKRKSNLLLAGHVRRDETDELLPTQI